MLLLYMGKYDECQAAADELRATYPTAAMPVLIVAALLAKQKKVDESISVLQKFVAANPDTAAEAHLTIAQVLLNEGSRTHLWRLQCSFLLQCARLKT